MTFSKNRKSVYMKGVIKNKKNRKDFRVEKCPEQTVEGLTTLRSTMVDKKQLIDTNPLCCSQDYMKTLRIYQRKRLHTSVI